MYIDVIVPSFDESGEDVLIATWYKKVGDKISNGEVIADAETSTIACGITSGYDCFLSKIIAKEGDTVPQGSKIAVIEVDVAKPSGEMSTETIKEIAEEELKNIHVSQDAEKKSKEIQNEQNIGGNSTQNEKDSATEESLQKEALEKEAAAASRAERRQALKDMENGKISAEEIERRRARREALQNIERAVQNEIKKEEEIEEEEDAYTLSVSTGNVSDDLVAAKDAAIIDDIIDEEDVLMDESLTTDEVSEKEAEIAEQKEFIEEEMENSEKEKKNSVVEGFAEQAEKKFKSILKDAESQAQKEADKLREKIIEDAKISALAESEVMKAKILKEYEDKAAKDASEMHKKIVQGSISEAQNTRTKLIEEAKAEAIKEATELKSKIKEEAQEAAEKEATLIKQNSLMNAEKQAKEEADKISKEIIERAIDESKAEANEIKKDIIKSAGRHAKKESEQLIKDELRHARKESQIKTEEIITATILETKKSANEIKEEVLNKTKADIQKIMSDMMQSILADSQLKIDQSADIRAKVAESMKESIDRAMNTKNEIIDEINQNRENTMKEMNETKNQIKESIDQANVIKEKLSEEIKDNIDQAKNVKEKLAEELKADIDRAIIAREKLSEEMRENIDQSVLLKDKILEEIKLCFGEIQEDVLKNTRETLVGLKDEILINTDKKIEEIKDSCRARDITDEIIEERINAKQDEIIEKLQNTEQKLQKLDTQEKQIKEKISEEKLEEEKLKEEDKIVEKLLNIKEDDGSAPGMYANNWNKPKFFYSPDDQRENIDFLRQRISEKMKDAYDSSVIATISNEVDMSAILSLEKAFGEAFSKKYNTRLGFTPFFIMAAVEALKHYKVFNAHVHEDEIIYKNHFDISVITCGNDGISAPVIREADKLNFAEIEKKMITLSRRAIEGTLSIEEVSNGTFTVVNAGMYGSLMGTDILTPPQVATLSVHKMHNRPVATDEGVEIRPMLYVSLSYDHRIADTKLAAEFLSKIKNYVENPGWQLLGL